MQRTNYHHGNLRAAILKTSTLLARAAGIQAVVAREVAREVGVAPAAIYRHFADIDQLRSEVSQAAREQLAFALIAARDSATTSRHAKVRARRRLEAAGRAYVHFAVREPGWFSAAFAADCDLPSRPDDPSAWDVLNGVLDELVECGALTSQRRVEAPMIAWAPVHGLASLHITRTLPADFDLEASTSSTLSAIQRALELDFA